ncbi:MAG: hypothetical protein JO246_17565, partial [Frankiaceae bacterium]|nr:hypothetical protein [Frankiaceae bacterium]
SAQLRYNRALAWRGQGGSWGVVVAKLGGSETGVANALDKYSGGQATTQVGNVSVQSLVAPNAPQGGGGSRPHGHHTTTPPTHPVTTPPTGPGHPSPKPTKSPVDNVVGTVGTVVKKVVGLLPTASPKPTSTGLLGGLLGH